MISMTSESWLNLNCKHGYPDMILVQLTIDIVPFHNTWPEVIGTYFIDHGNQYISEIHMAIIQFSMQ